MSETIEGAGETRPPLRIGIVGFGPTKIEAPYSDPSWTLWGMNGLWRVFPEGVTDERFSAWFEMHTDAFLDWHSKASKIGDAQFAWLKAKHPFPIFCQTARPDYPSSVAYPLEGIVDGFGHDYFTSSIAYALALAIATEGVAEIGLWGIDLTHGTEWADQRPCAEYWIGRAEGRGIKITKPAASALLSQRARYGYEDANPVVAGLRSLLQERLATANKGMSEAKTKNDMAIQELAVNDGAQQLAVQLLEQLAVWERGGKLG